MTIILLSVSLGKIAPLFVRDGTDRVSSVMTAIRKTPVSSVTTPNPVDIGIMGVSGDESADPSVHGGRERAVYVMPSEHYAFWQEQRVRARLPDEGLPHGFLGENLTISGLLEEKIYIGDELRIGNVTLAVTAPREPCFKFNARMGYTHAAKHMVQKGNCGWYARVVNPGTLQAGQTIEVTQGPRRLSIADEFARLNKRAIKSLF